MLKQMQRTPTRPPFSHLILDTRQSVSQYNQEVKEFIEQHKTFLELVSFSYHTSSFLCGRTINAIADERHAEEMVHTLMVELLEGCCRVLGEGQLAIDYCLMCERLMFSLIDAYSQSGLYNYGWGYRHERELMGGSQLVRVV